MYQNKLDYTISKLSTKLSKIKYKAIEEMVELVLAECSQGSPTPEKRAYGKDYRRETVRKAVIYHYFD